MVIPLQKERSMQSTAQPGIMSPVLKRISSQTERPRSRARRYPRTKPKRPALSRLKKLLFERSEEVPAQEDNSMGRGLLVATPEIDECHNPSVAATDVLFFLPDLKDNQRAVRRKDFFISCESHLFPLFNSSHGVRCIARDPHRAAVQTDDAPCVVLYRI